MLRQFIMTTLFLLFIPLLMGCAGRAPQGPVFPDVNRTAAAGAASLGDISPRFGNELSKAAGDYYMAGAELQTITRWYDRQVAEGKLVFVNEHLEPKTVISLYRVGSSSGPYLEILVREVNSSESLLVLYNSLEPISDLGNNGGWLRRIWGFLLGRAGPSLADSLFEWIVRVTQPIRPAYEVILLRPIINGLLAIRWVLSWSFGLTILLFAMCLSAITGLVKSVARGSIGFTLGRKLSMRVWIWIYIGIASLITLFVSTAIWETLNGMFDTSPSGQLWMSSRVYTFWSEGLHNLAHVPPTGHFLSGRLDKPNILIVPLAMFVFGLVQHVLNLLILGEVGSDTFRTIHPELAQFAGDMLSMRNEDTWQQDLTRIIRNGAILAFLPLGVALYFLMEKALDLWDSLVAGRDIFALSASVRDQKPLKQPSRLWKHVPVLILLIVLIGWLASGNAGAAFARVTSMLNTEVEATATVEATQRPLTTTTPTRGVTPTPTSTPIPTPSSTPSPAPSRTPTPYVLTAIVTANLLNARSGPGTDFEVVTQIPNDEVVVITGRNSTGEWLQIEYEARQVWVYTSFVEMNVSIELVDVVEP